MKSVWSIKTAAVATMLALAAWPVAIGMIGPAAAAPSGVTAAATLYAGQTTPVGEVYVWNDTTNVYVEIDIDSGWCMTESHVAVEPTLADIPQTKTFNPIPGKFPAGGTYATCKSSDTFTFAIADVGLNPFIAVHAKVWEKVTSTATIVSNAGDPIAFTETYPNFGAPVPAVVPTGYAGWPTINGASYISNQLAGDPFNVNRWREVTESLQVPGWPVSGILQVNSDNYEFTKLNGTEIERDDGSPTSTVENTAPEVITSPQAWATVQTVPFTPKMGTNSFDFVFRNTIWAGGGGFVDNPTGLIYKAIATYYAHSESAWAGTAVGQTPFAGANWATYFQYDVSLETATLYNVTSSPSTTWSCTGGVTDLTSPTDGTVTWARSGSTIYVKIHVVGGLASSTYDVWVEQNPGTCPPGTSTPSNPAALATDASGNGTVTFSFTALAGAQNFWLSLWTPAGSLTGTQVLRVPSVQL